MKTRTPLRILLATVMTLALLPMLSTFAPGGLSTASPAAADQVWYQSTGRASADAPCQKSSTEELADGWTQWTPSWAKWANKNTGGFVCNRQITWAFDSTSTSGSSSVTCTTTSGGSTPTPCAVGAYGPGGGVIFYDAGSEQSWGRYLEAAPSGWNTGADPTLEWGVNDGVNCSTLNITGAVGTDIGTGLANTTAITAACTTAARAPAAWAAKNYTGGGVSWFLPSKDELNQLYLRKAVVGGLDGDYYWSSSQSDASNARDQRFSDGFQDTYGKGNSGEVRPVRAF